MPKIRPPTTGYERLAQADRFSDDSDDEFNNAGLSASLNPSAAAGPPKYPPNGSGLANV